MCVNERSRQTIDLDCRQIVQLNLFDDIVFKLLFDYTILKQNAVTVINNIKKNIQYLN